MSVLEILRKARLHLEENGRMSLRMLRREFALDDDMLEEVVEELVDVQRVAQREGNVLVWVASGESQPPTPPMPAPERDPRSYTPKHLADKILQSKSALEGERKQVTVLFADIKGSMDLAAQLDPEDWHRLLERFFEILTEGVHRFEGTVNQYTGDGIMALFGAPIAHEDHAQRACHAALHLKGEITHYATDVKRRYGVGFQARMGINSGEVVVGRIGDDLRMDYTAQGHTVGLAQRMESLAEPNTCYLTAATAATVDGYFSLHDLGEFGVKGVADPMHVYELQGLGELRTRLDLAHSRGFTQLVGRGDELKMLESSLSRAGEGKSPVVGIVGEPGLGKSRLCFEFLERCRSRGLETYETTGVSHGKSIPFLPILDLLRAFFGIAEHDSEARARGRILDRLPAEDESLHKSLPLLFDFLGVPDPDHATLRNIDPDARQRQLVDLIRRVVKTRNETVVLLLEDLQWFDTGSAGFLELLVEALLGTPTLLLLNFRPEFEAPWFGKSFYHQLPITPLGPEGIGDLLDALLGADSSLAGLNSLIHRSTAGNPFFIEEVVQSLIESGKLQGDKGAYRLTAAVDTLQVPGSVKSLLAARIDRLSERDKSVLQTAAVIGREFSAPTLAAVAQQEVTELSEALRSLKDKEFIYEQSLYPVAEYVFKHPLTHEVALSSQLRERRERLHAQVARVLEKAHSEDPEPQAALLAHHWAEAQDWTRAAHWYRRAAEWVGLSDPREALGHWRRVRELTPGMESEQEREELALQTCVELFRLGWRMGGNEEESATVYAEGRALAERIGDRYSLALLVGFYGLMRSQLSGSGLDYVRYGEQAAEIAAESDDPALQAAIWSFPAFGWMDVGNGPAVLEWAARVHEKTGSNNALGKEIAGYSPRVGMLHARANALTLLGRFEEAWAASRDAEVTAEEAGELEVLGWILMARTMLAYFCGSGESVLEHAHRCREIAEELGNESSRTMAYGAFGFAHLVDTQPAAARDSLQSSLAIAREHRAQRGILPLTLAVLSKASLELGEHSDALSAAREAIDLARAGGCWFYEAEAQLALAAALLAEGEAGSRPEIEAALDRAEELVESVEGRALSPQILEVRGRLAGALGDTPGSSAVLQQALELYRSLGAAGHAERLALELAS